MIIKYVSFLVHLDEPKIHTDDELEQIRLNIEQVINDNISKIYTNGLQLADNIRVTIDVVIEQWHSSLVLNT